MTKSKYDARHQLKQLGWSDEELDAIGLSLQDEGKVTIPERPWYKRYLRLKALVEANDFEGLEEELKQLSPEWRDRFKASMENSTY
jgi:hypothetical protein